MLMNFESYSILQTLTYACCNAHLSCNIPLILANEKKFQMISYLICKNDTNVIKGTQMLQHILPPLFIKKS